MILLTKLAYSLICSGHFSVLAETHVIKLFGLKWDATFENNPLLRQLIAGYESKILTPFRRKGLRINLKTLKMEEEDLKFKSVDEVIEHIGKLLEVRIKLGVKPGPVDYDISHIDYDFFPTGGYNIL